MIRSLFMVVALVSSTASGQQPEATFSGAVDLTGSAEDWQLEQADWNEYLALMRGPSGLLYASMSPFYVLGVNAEDPSRQREFAQRSLELNEQRLKQVMAFYQVQKQIANERGQNSQASTEALNKLLKPADTLREFIKTSTRSTLPTGGRLSAYLAINQCPDCDAIATRLIERGDVDFYFIDASSDDEIRAWAIARDIDVNAVMQGHITLNNDNEQVFAKLAAGDPPVVFRQGAQVTQ